MSARFYVVCNFWLFNLYTGHAKTTYITLALYCLIFSFGSSLYLLLCGLLQHQSNILCFMSMLFFYTQTNYTFFARWRTGIHLNIYKYYFFLKLILICALSTSSFLLYRSKFFCSISFFDTVPVVFSIQLSQNSGLIWFCVSCMCF